jgi:hypothetical protein
MVFAITTKEFVPTAGSIQFGCVTFLSRFGVLDWAVVALGREHPSPGQDRRQMKKSQFSRAEITLGEWSRAQAESEVENVTRDQLAEAIADFIEWRAFSYWVRLIHEHGGGAGRPGSISGDPTA